MSTHCTRAWTTIKANLDPGPDVGQVFSWRLTACSWEPPSFTTKTTFLHSFWGFCSTAIRVRVSDLLLLSKRNKRNFLEMLCFEGKQHSSAKPRGLWVAQDTLCRKALQPVFQSSAESAVRWMCNYVAEIGQNHALKVATQWCALQIAALKCPRSMTRSAPQASQQKPARVGTRLPWKTKIHLSSLGLSQQASLSVRLVLLQRQEEGGKEKASSLALWLQNSLQAGLQHRRNFLVMTFCCLCPRKAVLVEQPALLLHTLFIRCASETRMCRAKRTAQPQKAAKWDCCGGCLVTCWGIDFL